MLRAHGDGDGIITVPPTLTRQERASLLHEYGHHIDATYGNGARADPNGTPRWWRARGMGRLVRRGLAVPSYAHGWSHSIGEIFAEDYMAMNGGGRSGIGWLRQPSAAVRAALRADIAQYPGPRPEWPAGASAWRGFTAACAVRSVPRGRAMNLPTWKRPCSQPLSKPRNHLLSQKSDARSDIRAR